MAKSGLIPTEGEMQILEYIYLLKRPVKKASIVKVIGKDEMPRVTAYKSIARLEKRGLIRSVGRLVVLTRDGQETAKEYVG